MKKMFLAENGEEVKMGDIIFSTATLQHPVFGDTDVKVPVCVDKEILPTLIEKGIIIVKDNEATGPDHMKSMDIKYYIQKIANKLGCSYKDAEELLSHVNSIYPAAVLGILLREIAIEFDSAYDNHIKNSPILYIVSLLDGRITKVHKTSIRSYKNFAAFRSIRDAKLACRIVRDILKPLFKDDK